MRNGTSTHLNRTGAALSPALTAELMEGAEQTRPTSPSPKEDGLARVRKEYAAEGEPTGTIPPPVTFKGLLKSAAKAMTGKESLVLADKLGERMAFERSGTRLYDALLSKFDAYGSWKGGPARQDLMQIRLEEHAHFTLVKTCIEELGADPTAVTPSANLHAVASKGLCAVLSDPRTNLRESMEAILVAELVDNDCWENLVDLARALGHEEMAQAFTEALAEEQEHLRKVRAWLGASLSGQATGKLAEPFAARADERERRLVVAAEAMDEAAEAEGPARGRPAPGTRSRAGNPAVRPGRRAAASPARKRTATSKSTGRSAAKAKAKAKAKAGRRAGKAPTRRTR